jgi:hypothetical protein
MQSEVALKHILVHAENGGDILGRDGAVDRRCKIARLSAAPEHGNELEGIVVDGLGAPGIIP